MDKIEKIARRITAGGGAGITFVITETSGEEIYKLTAKYENGDFTDVKVEKQTSEEPLAIDKFNANGYMDGMNDVSGKKVFSSVELDGTAVHDYCIECLDYIKEYFEGERLQNAVNIITNGAVFHCQIADGKSTENTMGGGYIRTKMTEGSVVEFKNDVRVYFDNFNEIDGDIYDVTIRATLNETGGYWYEDVFTTFGDEDYDQIQEDCKENYGA